MPAVSVNDRRFLLTLLAFGAEAGILAWEYLNGGVRSHHLLANPDLPAVSNWWGLLVIPLLTWWTLSQLRRRAESSAARSANGFAALVAFVCALAYGLALSLLFAQGSMLVDYAFFGLLALALVLRLWHGEYLLGFVFGMGFVIGPILPGLFGAVIALLSWAVHTVRRALWRKVRSRRGLA
ncbi:hypothetical protein RCH14_000682 [Massilia sp. MP_M2]|uniref:hypothetical protein n=1 Tax=Massilia sp. MP_M2 TaxID=3071713 RepID=UPI00319DC54E